MIQKKKLKELQNKADESNVSDIPASRFMGRSMIYVKDGYSIKGTIETLKTHNLSGIAVVDDTEKLKGFISEYDLLIQAASQDFSSPIKYKTEVYTLELTTTLKEALILFYRKKLKICPVVDENYYLQGMVSRLDILGQITRGNDLTD